LREIARAAAEASEAAVGADQDKELEHALVAILAADAAVEAALNERVEYAYDLPLTEWWKVLRVAPPGDTWRRPRQLWPLPLKWAALVADLTKGLADPTVQEELRELSDTRNLVAHGRGVEHADGRKGMSGPTAGPDGKTLIRTTYNAECARRSVDQAEAAIAMIPKLGGDQAIRP
jgi:hypothetical protein